MGERYNGWINYETWLVNLWETNSSEWLREEAERLIQEALDSDKSPEKARDEAISALAEQLQEQYEQAAEERNGGRADALTDLLGAALSEVNWREIATNHVGDVDIYSVGHNDPGYMPDADPWYTTCYADARTATIDSIEEWCENACEQLCEGSEEANNGREAEIEAERDEAISAIRAAKDGAEITVHFLGHAFWIGRV